MNEFLICVGAVLWNIFIYGIGYRAGYTYGYEDYGNFCPKCDDRDCLTDEQIAAMFHEAYERLAPTVGYRTRMESSCTWERVPENNRKLMTAVVGEIREKL